MASKRTRNSRHSRKGNVRRSLKLERTGSSYAVEVPRSKAMAIFGLQPSLLNRLDMIDGVTDVNYDGHLGPYVYLTIDTPLDTPKTHAAVVRTIQSALDEV